MMAEKQKPKLSKDQRTELEGKLVSRKCLLAYVERRVEKEEVAKEEIIASGKKYHGLLSMLLGQKERLEDGTYWEQTTSDIEKLLEE